MTEEQKTILADVTALAETPVCHTAIDSGTTGIRLSLVEAQSGSEAMYLAIQSLHRELGYNW